ncbi:N-6 DNA methylase [Streptomyces scabiei]|uniref:N-6 DNA methylase n=1 Tax=Streptomyces scabiei TaxID=1930 RepID=UPI0035AB8032
MSDKNQELADFIWSVADLLRGDYKRSEYGKVILPMTVLRRMDCVMEDTRKDVWARAESYAGMNKDGVLRAAAGRNFWNLSQQSFATIGADQDTDKVEKNLKDFIDGFSAEATEILDHYAFHLQIERLAKAGLLYLVVQKFAEIDLSPAVVDNHNMGFVFEELIRKFADASNETAGEHFTPREVIELMVELLLAPDAERLTGEAPVVDILDPACGTGGMLSAAEEHIKTLNPRARVNLFGQEVNAESYAICRSDMLLKDQTASNICFGNSFTQDGHEDEQFEYMLANPPFGVEWKKVEKEIKEEYEDRGYDGRFGAGLPPINDGSFLFLQHMIQKMRPLKKDAEGREVGGSRIAVVFNGSPLTGVAGSGESEIRRWIIENDYLEAIVALPDQLFYNTDLSAYFWIVTNRKPKNLKNRIILVDARDQWRKMSKSLSKKRKRIAEEQRREICHWYGQAYRLARSGENSEHSVPDKVKVLAADEFGYKRIAVDRPLKLRFEVTEDTLDALRASRVVAREFRDPEKLVDALKPLVGSSWATKAQAWGDLLAAMAEKGVTWPKGKPFDRAMRDAVGVPDPEGEIQYAKKDQPEHDPGLRNFEYVPLRGDIDEYFACEVKPNAEEAWIAESKNAETHEIVRFRIGYEIPFTRHFYVYESPNSPTDIDREMKALEAKIQTLLSQLATLDDFTFAEISETVSPGGLRKPRAEGSWRWLPELPDSFKLVRLAYVARLQNGLTVDAKRDITGDVVTRPYLRVANVQAGRLALDSVTEITVPRSVARRSTLRAGDVLMTEGGDLDKLGRGTVWRGELEGCLHQNHIFAIRPDERHLDGEYLAYVTQSLHGRCYFESTGTRTTNLASTNSSKIQNFPVPLPPVPTQKALVRSLNASLDRQTRLRDEIERQLALLIERQRALSTAAVTGRLRVSTT